MELTWQVLPSPSLQKVSERMPEHFSEEECCLQLEGVGLVFETVASGSVILRGDEDTAGFLQREVIADAYFQTAEEADTASYVPGGGHVLLVKVAAA